MENASSTPVSRRCRRLLPPFRSSVTTWTCSVSCTRPDAECRNKGRNEVEVHIDDPSSSEIFKAFPTVLANKALTHFVCDYFRLIVMGSARPHEIEALMDEEIDTLVRSKLKPYSSLMTVAEGLPALESWQLSSA